MANLINATIGGVKLLETPSSATIGSLTTGSRKPIYRHDGAIWAKISDTLHVQVKQEEDRWVVVENATSLDPDATVEVLQLEA